MSEWIINGNKPRNPNFEGELTDRQQYLVDLWEAQDRLTPFLGRACLGCKWAQVDIVNPAAYDAVKGELTKEQAIQQVTDVVRTCTGPEADEHYYDADPHCPHHELQNQEKESCF